MRFVEDLGAAGEALPSPRNGTRYEMATGVRAAIDIMLAVLQTNRDNHADWLDLILFSAVVAANCRGHRLPPRTARPTTPATASRHLMA